MLLLKQEMRKIKEEDKLFNYNRHKKMKDYKLKKMMEKSKKNKEKLEIMKVEQDLIKMARVLNFQYFLINFNFK